MPGEDRFSVLPESLILRILSLLPFRDVITGTRTLSKRFRHLWTQLPNLMFGPVSNQKHISLVTETLSLRRDTKIDSLSLDVIIKGDFSQVLQWIDLATACGVESLDLRLRAEDDDDCPPSLPEQLYTTPSLRKLKIEYVSIDPPIGEVRWNSLNSLSINDCEISSRTMSKILAGCPVLESLAMDFWIWGPVERLVLASNSVRKLKFHGTGDQDILPKLCLPSLVEASLFIRIIHEDGGVQCEEIYNRFQEILRITSSESRSVKTLDLNISRYCPVKRKVIWQRVEQPGDLFKQSLRAGLIYK